MYETLFEYFFKRQINIFLEIHMLGFFDSVEEFNEWRSEFLCSLDIKNISKEHLERCSVLIDHIATFNKLLPPISKFTDDFIENTLIDSITQILNCYIHDIDKNKIDMIMNFLKKATLLLPICFINHKKNLFPKLYKLTDEESIFYKSVASIQRNMNPIKQIYEYIISHEYFSLMLFYLKNNNLENDEANFFFFLNNFQRMNHEIDENIRFSLLFNLVTILNQFMEKLKSNNKNIREIDQEMLLNIFSILFNMPFSDTELLKQTLSLIFSFGEKALEEQNIEYQLFGAKIFNALLKAPNQSLDIFLETIQNKNFVSDLVSRDLHPNVISAFNPVLKIVAEKKCFDKKEIQKIWNIAKYLNEKSEKDILFELVIDMLNKFNGSQVLEFLTQNKEQSEFFLTLLIRLLSKRRTNNDETKKIFSLVIEVGSKLDLTKDYLKPLLSSSFKNEFVNQLLETINNEFNHFCISQLLYFFNSYPKSINDFIQEDLFKKICEYLEAEVEYNNDVLSLIFKIIKESNKFKINKYLIDQVLKFDQIPEFWENLNSLKPFSRCFETDAYKNLQSYIQNTDPLPSYPQFAKFFKEWMFWLNKTEGKIVINRNKTEYYSYPLKLQDQLFREILNNPKNNYICLEYDNIFLDFYPKNFVKHKLLEYFSSLFEKSKTDEQLIRLFHLLQSYCNKYDKNMKFIPHNSIVKPHFDMRKTPISLSIYFQEKEITQIEYEKDSPCINILSIVGPFLNEPFLNYSIEVNKKNVTFLNASSFNGFKNSTKVYIKKKESPTIVFSEQLASSELINTFLNYLSESHSKELYQTIWKFLCYLPTDIQLIDLSMHHEKFIKEMDDFLSNSNNNSCYKLKYLLQTLIWRITNPEYEKEYSNFLPQLLTKIINRFDDQRGDYINLLCNEFIYLYKYIPFDLFLSISLNILSGEEPNKDHIIRIIYQEIHKMDNNKKKQIYEKMLNGDNINKIYQILIRLSSKEWDDFKKILLDEENKEYSKLDEMSSQALQKKPLNTEYFHEIMGFCLLQRASHKDSGATNEELINKLQFYLKLFRDNQSKSITDILSSLLTKNHELRYETLFDDLIEVALNCNDSFIIEKLFDLIDKLSKENQIPKEKLNSFINKINKINIESWNFSSELDGNPIKYRGLRNLQATCYMNSTIQQLFHIPAFQHLIFHLNNDNNQFFLSMQKLFYYMKFSKAKYCDTAEFFKQFSSIHNNNYQPYEQQDVQEFLQFFINDLPDEIQNLFKGVILNKITEINSENPTFTSEYDEPFLTLPLSINNNNMNESLESLANDQFMYGDNQYIKPDGSKIDVIKSQIISKCPNILIIQLKRFEFDVQTHEWVKLNKKFEIQNHISLNSICLNSNDSQFDYTLHGVISHRGDRVHGHYTSIVNLDDDWIRFDDIVAQKIDEKQFQKEVYGENQTNSNQMYESPNGYILFYLRDNSEIVIDGEKKSLTSNFHEKYNNQFINEIEKQNQEILLKFCLFLKPVINFLMNNSSEEQLISFYFNIFCHLKINNTEIIEIIYKKFDSIDPQYLLHWLINHTESHITTIYMNNTNETIFKLTSKIISNIPSKLSNNTDIYKLIDNLIKNLNLFIQRWRQINEFGNLILLILENLLPNNFNKNKTTFHNNWVDSIIDFICNFYEKQQSENILKYVCLQNIFNILKILSTKANKKKYEELFNRKYMILKSTNSEKSFKELLIKCSLRDIFDLVTVERIFPSEFEGDKGLCIYLSKIIHEDNYLNSPELFMKIINQLQDHHKYSLRDIILYFKKNINDFREVLKNNYDFLLKSLIDSDMEQALLLKDLISDIFKEENKARLLNSIIEKIPELNQEGSREVFLELFFSLLNETKFPKDKKIDGLHKIPINSHYLLKIYSYFDSKEIIRIFEDIFKDVNQSNLNDKMNGFIEIFESLNKDIFIELISKPQWKSIIQCYYSMKPDDLENLKKIVSILIKRNDCNEYTHSLIFRIITNDQTPIKSPKALFFAQYIKNVIKNIKFDELSILFTIFQQNIDSKDIASLMIYANNISDYMNNHPNYIDQYKEIKIDLKIFLKIMMQKESKNDFILSLIKLLGQIAKINEELYNKILQFQDDKFNEPNNQYDLYILAALVIEIISLQNVDENHILKIISIIENATKFAKRKSKRGLLFKQLNTFNESNTDLSYKIAMKIFANSKYDKKEEKTYFESALQSIPEACFNQFVEECANKFDFTRIDGSCLIQLEKVLLIKKSFKAKTNEIIQRFNLNNQSKYNNEKLQQLMNEIFE